MIGATEDGGGSQGRGKVGDSLRDVRIYAVGLLGSGVKGAGSDKSRSSSLEIQAPGISRKLLLSPVAIA